MKDFKLLNLTESSEKENNRVPLLKRTQSLSKGKSLEEVVIAEYGDCIEKIQKLKENEIPTEDCLKLHRITDDLRSKMVD